jgi:hypothetical protein
MDIKQILKGTDQQTEATETIKTIRKKYENINYGDHDAHQRADHYRSIWSDLCVPIVEKAIQSGDVETFFETIFSTDMPPGGREPAHLLAREHLNAFMAKITSAEQAYKYYWCYGSRSYWNYACSLKSRSNELSLIDIQAAKGIEAYEAALKKTIRGEKPFELLMEKWGNDCETVDQIKRVRSIVEQYPDCVKHAIHRTEAILFVEIPKVQDIETIKSYYLFAPADSAAKLLAFEKWLSLCKTPMDADEAFKNAPRDKACCLADAYRKVRELASA